MSVQIRFLTKFLYICYNILKATNLKNIYTLVLSLFYEKKNLISFKGFV